MTKKILLLCGIFSMLWYVFMNIIVPIQYPGYDLASQTVSELSAIDAPTRQFWFGLSIFYNLLFMAFGTGLWISAKGSRKLRYVAAFIIFDAAIGFFWPPMNRREIIAAGAGTASDIFHLVWAFVHLVLMLLMIGFGTAIFGKTFRIFSLLIIVVFIIFGILTTRDSSGIAANLPTPYLGIWERINIGAYMLWIIVFSILMIKRKS